MKNYRILLTIMAGLLILVLNTPPAVSSSTTFVPLGTGDPFTYDGIPFKIDGVHVTVSHNAPPDDLYWHPFTEVATYNLSGYIAEKVHLIELAAWADNVPDGVVVGYVNVYYADNALTTLDLVIGENIAEWAYDRPELQPYLQHTKIPPAYSFWEDTDSAYWGHNFYVSIDTEEKPLSYLELVLDPASYTGQQWYGYAPADWFGISINAITLEALELVEATIDIDPDTLNINSKGNWITCYIELPDYDVEDIDVSTVMLEDTILAEASPTEVGDNDDDGVPDLMVKFDRLDVCEILDPEDEVEITVTGELTDGRKFIGSDTIRVIDKGGKKK